MRLHKSIKVLDFQLLQIFSSPHIPLTMLLVAIFIYATVQPVNAFATAVGISATPWVFPHITNDFVCQLVIMAAAILIFCNAPFEGDGHIYILLRAGNRAWTMGICFYIIILSFIYIFLVMLAGTAALFPNIQFSLGWGKIWGTLARTNAGSQFGLIFSVNDYIVGAYSPIQSFIISFLLEWACCSWLGLITYFFNRITNTVIGSLIATTFVFLDITIANEWDYTFYRISPVTMAQIHTLSGSKSLYGLTTEYAVSFFVISIIVLVVMCVLTPSIKKHAILHFKKGDHHA